MILFVGPVNNLGLEMLSSMFGGLGTGSLAVPNRSNGKHSCPIFSLNNCFG